MLKYILAASVALMLLGCGQRENAKAALQASQAATAIQKIAQDPGEDLPAAMQRILTLSYSAQLSLDPVIKELAADEVINVPTTVDDALADAHQFAIHAAIQAGRAQGEQERNASLRTLAKGGWNVAGLLALVGGGGTFGVVILNLLSKLKSMKAAVQTTVAYAEEAKTIDPKDAEAMKALKEKHIALQTANGTRPIIDDALKKV